MSRCNTILSTMVTITSSPPGPRSEDHQHPQHQQQHHHQQQQQQPRRGKRTKFNLKSNSKSNLKSKSKSKSKNTEPPVYVYKGLEEVPKTVTNASIHPSVTEIDMYAFKGCSKLQSVSVPVPVSVPVSSSSSFISTNNKSISNLISKPTPKPEAIEGVVTGTVVEKAEETVTATTTTTAANLKNSSSSNNNNKTETKNKKIDNILLPPPKEQQQHQQTTTILPHPKLTTIGRSAFGHCTSLTTIQIPFGVTRIGENAFRDCIALTQVNIPPTVKSIGVCAFRCCKALRVLDVPCSIEQIGIAAFYHCESLVSITMPSSLGLMNTNVNVNMNVNGNGIFWNGNDSSSSNYDASYASTSTSTSAPLALDSALSFSSSSSSSSPTSSPTTTSTLRIYPAAFRGCKNLILMSLPKSVNVKFIQQSGGFDHVRYPYFSQCTLLQRGVEAAEAALLNNSNSSSGSSVSSGISGSGSVSSSRSRNNHIGIGRNGNGIVSVANRRRVGTVNHSNTNTTTDTAVAAAAAANHPTNTANRGGGGGGGPIGDQEIISWLQHRFENLPLHQECYDQNTTLKKVQHVLRSHRKRDTAYGVDVLGINVLHVLACTHTDVLYSDYDCTMGGGAGTGTGTTTLATKSLQRKIKEDRIEIMKHVMDINPSLPYMEDKIYHMTPLQLFLKCVGVQFFYHHHHHHSQHKQRYLSQSLKKGLSWNIIELVLVLDPESKLELSREDEYTSLVPFLQAASLQHSSLDVVYNLVRESVEILVSMTTSKRRVGRVKAVKSYTKRWNR